MSRKGRAKAKRRRKAQARSRGVSPQARFESVQQNSKRRPPTPFVTSDDTELNDRKRAMLEGTGRDLYRNASIARWMINKDIDFNTSYSFQSHSGDRGFDKEFEQFIATVTSVGLFDVTRRYSLDTWLPMAYRAVLLGGDIWPQKCPSLQRIATITGDRVLVPNGSTLPKHISENRGKWINGVLPHPAGGVRRICVCNRDARMSSYSYHRDISGQFVWQIFNPEWFDNIRGVSALASGINDLVDTHEMFAHAKARAKLAHMFGLMFKRTEKYSEAWLNQNAESLTAETTDEEGNDITDTGAAEDHPVKLTGSPFKVELGVGEDAEIMNTNLNASDSAQISEMMIMLSLKTLDIPMSFYDEARTNYYASKGAMESYLQGCHRKQLPWRQWLNSYTVWRTQLAIANSRFALPRGKTLGDIPFSWRPRGRFWLDRLREYKADDLALQTGQTSQVQLGLRDGYDAYDILEEQTAYEKERLRLRKEAGLDAGGDGPATTNITPDRDANSFVDAIVDELETRGLVGPAAQQGQGA